MCSSASRSSICRRNSYGETRQQLEDVLERNDVRVHPGARYRLDLVKESTRQRVASYTSAARSAEYELTSELTYQFRGPQDRLLLEDSVEVQKVYVHDENNLIGSDQEAEQLRQEMRRELIQQMVMRIQRIAPAQLDQLQQEAEPEHAPRPRRSKPRGASRARSPAVADPAAAAVKPEEPPPRLLSLPSMKLSPPSSPSTCRVRWPRST